MPSIQFVCVPSSDFRVLLWFTVLWLYPNEDNILYVAKQSVWIFVPCLTQLVMKGNKCMCPREGKNWRMHFLFHISTAPITHTVLLAEEFPSPHIFWWLESRRCALLFLILLEERNNSLKNHIMNPLKYYTRYCAFSGNI